MSFSSDLKAFQKLTLKKSIEIKRLSALDLFSAIVLETPVDKGVLRNNWFAEIGNGSSQMTAEDDKSGTKALARIKKVLNGTSIAKDTFFTNNLPYASTIEFDGHSGKAPNGMVRVNTARWEEIVKLNLRKVTNAS